MKKIYFFILAILLLGVTTTRAQNTEGYDFWVTFGANYIGSGLQPPNVVNLQIRIANSRDEVASGTIYLTALDKTIPFTVAPYGVYTYNLDQNTGNASERTAVYNMLSGGNIEETSSKTIRIQSHDIPITVYALSQFLNSADATNVLPVTALGDEYYQISYKPRSGAKDAFAVIATKNNTKVYYDHGTTHVATLDIGEVYYRTTIDHSASMTGKHIQTNEPVALFCLNQGVLIPTDGASGDCLMQQLSPIKSWGKKFFVPVSKSFSNTNCGTDRVRIVASKNGTNITKYGGGIPLSVENAKTYLTGLNAGDYVEFEVTESSSGCYIESNNRIGVCTYLRSGPSGSNSNRRGDPAIAWLPAIEQTSAEAVISPFIPNTTSSNLHPNANPPGLHYAIIITPTATAASQTQLEINGVLTPLTGDTWKAHPQAGMSYYVYQLGTVPNTSYRFKNPGKLLVMGYGIGQAESYYYLGFAAQRDLDVTFSVNDEDDRDDQLFCDHNFDLTVDIDEFEDGGDEASLTWYLNGDITCTGMLSCSFLNLPTGNHTVKLDYVLDDEAKFIEKTLRVGATILVSVSDTNRGTISLSSEDVCFASGSTLTLTAIESNPAYIFAGWVNGNGDTVSKSLTCTLLVTGYSNKGGTQTTQSSNDTLLVTGDINLTASFILNQMNVYVSVSPPGSGTVTITDDDGNPVALVSQQNIGEILTLVATNTNQCYEFSHWTKNGDTIHGAGGTLIHEVEADVNLVAHFNRFTYPVTITASDPFLGSLAVNGVPIVSGTQLDVLCGENLIVTATVNLCAKFINWTIDGAHQSSSLSYALINVTDTIHLVANFEPLTFAVTVTENQTGWGWACCTDSSITCNSDFTVIALDTNPMYKFTHWSEGAAIYTDNPYNFTVERDYNLVANFEVRTFSVYTNANPTPGGSTQGGGNHIPYGTTITLEAFANQDYNFHNWTNQDNVVVSWDSTFFYDVFDDAILTANFILKRHRIRVYAVPNSGGTVAGDTLFISQGAIHTITATAFPAFHFKYWTTDSANGTIIPQAGPVFNFPVERSCDFFAHFERDSYNVTFEAIPHHGGYIVPNDTIVIWGTELNIEAIENPFFTFNGWSKNGVPFSMSPVISPTITEDCHFVAYFTSETFEVTVLAAPEAGGSVWSTDTSEVPYLTPVTITATPDSCYNFICWMEADTVVTENPVYTFEIEGNRIFTAIFEIKIFMITAFANPGGTVDVDTAYMDCGDEFTVIAKPDIGYRFINWTVNNEEFSTNDTLTFIVNDSLNLVAHFEFVTYHIILDREPFIGGQVQTSGVYPMNYDLTVHAIPNPGFKFVRWMEEDTIEASLNKDYQFFVDRDRTLTAHFTNDSLNVILRVNPMQNGWGTVEGGGTDIPYETLVTIKAIPKDNFEFVNWTEEDGSFFHKNDTLTFPVVRSLNLTANFKPRDFTVNVSANPEPGGTVTGGGTFEYGSANTIMAYPNLQYEYEFENWVDIDSNRVISWQPERDFVVLRNYNLVANFTPKYCKVTVTADPTTGGKVEGSIDSIPMGTLWTVHAEPNDHYVFVKWTENGDSIHNQLDYEFIVIGNHNLTAHFVKETVVITVSAYPPQAAAMLTGNGAYYHGDPVTVEAIANEHYYFLYWMVNGDTITDENPHSFIAEQDEGWVAIFGTNTYTITLLCNPPDVATLEGGGTFTYGEQTTIQAFPDACYEFVEWTEADTAVTDYTFMVDRDRTFVAHFTQNRFNITTTVNPETGGTVSPQDTTNLECGAEITLYAEAHEGYTFANWTEGDEIVCDTTDYTFEVIRSRHLTANFTPNIYTITVIADPPELGSVSGGGEIPYGEEITVYATPRTNYDFVSWTEDSVVVSTSAAYTFTVTGSRMLTANFEVPKLDFDTYAATLWNNTFLLNLKKLEDENFDIVGCKWFKNGLELTFTNTKDQYSYSAGPGKYDRLDLAPHYYSFQLTTGFGDILYSTIKLLNDYLPAPAKNQLLVYPNPVGSGNTFTVERLTKDTPIEVFNQYGVCLSRTIATDEITTLSLNLPSGVYFIRNDHKEGKVVIIR